MRAALLAVLLVPGGAFAGKDDQAPIVITGHRLHPAQPEPEQVNIVSQPIAMPGDDAIQNALSNLPQMDLSADGSQAQRVVQQPRQSPLTAGQGGLQAAALAAGAGPTAPGAPGAQDAGLAGMVRNAGGSASGMAHRALGWLKGGGSSASADGGAGDAEPAPGGATQTQDAARSQAKAISTLNAVGGQLVGESAAMQTDGVGGHGGPGGIPGGFTGLESTPILARGRMQRAMADEGLTGTMKNGQPDIRGRDGRQASKEQLDALLARYKNEPAALNRRPDFLEVLPPSHYDELRKRFPRDTRDPAAPLYRGMALAGGKDFLWASGPQRGQDIAPETLEGTWRALPKPSGAKPEEPVAGAPVADADPAQAETVQVAPGTEGYQVTGLSAEALETAPQTGGVYAGGLGGGRRAEQAELDVVGRGLALKAVPAAGGPAAEEPLPLGKIVAGGAAFGFLIAAALLALRKGDPDA